MRITTETPPTRVGRAGGRRVRHIPGVPSDALPPNGAVELPDEEEQELDADDVATALNPFDETDDDERAEADPFETDEAKEVPSGRKLITGGDPDAPARIPMEEQFGDEPFVSDSQLDRIAAALQDKRSLPTLDVVIQYRFKAKGGKRAGKPNTGGCVKLSGLTKHFGKADYVIWIAADHAREMHYTAWQLEAELYRQMLKMQVEENEEGDINRTVRGYDAEMFFLEFQHYGPWRFELRRVEDVVKVRQTSLF